MEWLEISLADEDTAGTPAGTADPHTRGAGVMGLMYSMQASLTTRLFVSDAHTFLHVYKTETSHDP